MTQEINLSIGATSHAYADIMLMGPNWSIAFYLKSGKGVEVVGTVDHEELEEAAFQVGLGVRELRMIKAMLLGVEFRSNT